MNNCLNNTALVSVLFQEFNIPHIMKSNPEDKATERLNDKAKRRRGE